MKEELLVVGVGGMGGVTDWSTSMGAAAAPPLAMGAHAALASGGVGRAPCSTRERWCQLLFLNILLLIYAILTYFSMPKV